MADNEQSLEDQAEDIRDRIDDQYRDQFDIEDIVTELEKFHNFGVFGSEAEDGAISNLARQAEGVSDRSDLLGDSEGYGDADFVDINRVRQMDADQWVSVEAKVTQIWDSSDAVSQVGLLDDGTGRVKFIAWAKSDAPLVSENETYEFRNAVTKVEESEEYGRQIMLSINSNTEITPSDTEITTSDETQTIRGILLGLNGPNGLVVRDEDGRVITDADAGDGEHDLRIKAVFDTGKMAYTLIANRELTEELTGMTLDEAVDIAREELDRGAVARQFEGDIVGRYYEVDGNLVGDDMLLADEIRRVTEHEQDADELLVRARSL